MKLGKLAPRKDHRDLLLAKYLLPQLPAPPVQVDYTTKISNWGSMLNDDIGDCAIAAAGHLIEEWLSEVGSETVIPDNAILEAYEAVSGYNPNNPASDIGCCETDVLNYWRQTGIASHKINSYAAININNLEEVKQSIYLFEGIYTGFALPISCQEQGIWDTPSNGQLTGNAKPGSWGGHAIPILAYDDTGPIVITWGFPKKMTWNFFISYCDEAYGIISNDMLGKNQETPNCLNLAQLNADLSQVS